MFQTVFAMRAILAITMLSLSLSGCLDNNELVAKTIKVIGQITTGLEQAYPQEMLQSEAVGSNPMIPTPAQIMSNSAS